jgi:chaperonin GroEL
MKEKKDRVDDALCATKAAVEEGIVIGGGVALATISVALSANVTGHDDYSMGYKIVLKAMQSPLRQIVKNADISDEVVLATILRNENSVENFGYNARNNTYVNMLDAGIIDPTKVTRSALQYAASVAGLMLTTQCMITDAEDKTPAPSNNDMM